MQAVNLFDPQTPPRIFVSYARADGEEAARNLVNLLTDHELAAWFDHLDLDGGIAWWRQVEAALQKVEHLVLVLTPEALRSPNVEREWRYARRQGVQVSPVRISSGLDVSRLPRWMEKAHRPNLAVPEQRQRLLRALQGPGRTTRVPFMASSPEPGLVPRPEEFAALKRAILGGGNEPVAITAALRGAGGFGKTELARFLCHDDDIEEAFDGGILWATLGEAPSNPVAMLADLTAALRGRIPEVTGLDAAKAALAEALDDRACLLVIDDVWRRRDVEPLLHRGPRDRTTRLIATRDDAVLPRDARKVPVDAMQPGEAVSLLTRGLPPFPGSLQLRIDDLAQRRLGGWPLVLSQANALLYDRIARNEPAERALDYLERSLARRGITGTLRVDDPEDRRRSAAGTLDISLGQLDAEQARARFGELGVFGEDADITLDSVAILWGRDGHCNEIEVDELCGRLRKLSLVRDLDLGRRTLRVHDVIRSLLRERLGDRRLAKLEIALVDGWRERCSSDWSRLTDQYALRFLPAHLASLGRADELSNLLLDPKWMTAKLTALGGPALLADYRTFAGDHENAVGLVGRALNLAAGSLAGELPVQLVGRLSPADAPELALCLDAALKVIPAGSLVPLRPSLTAPGAELRRFVGHEEWITAVVVLADGKRALSASHDRTLRLWDLESGAELRRFERHEDRVDARVDAIAVLADGKRALTASGDRTLRLWDLESGVELRCFGGREEWITAVVVLADDKRALSASLHTLRLWDLESGAELRRIEEYEEWITAVAVSADGKRALLSAAIGTPLSDDCSLRLWDLESGAELRRFQGPEGGVSAIVALADDKRALFASDCSLRLWDLESGAELRRFEGHKYRVNAVAALADGKRALSASYDHTLRLWDLESGAELRRFEGHEAGVLAVAVLADGKRALSASGDHTLRLWDLESGAKSHRFERHEGAVNAVAMLANGKRALSASEDHTLRLWDLESGAELRRFQGHESGVTAVAALADGERALSASGDSTFRLWHLQSGAELCRFRGREQWVTAVAVSADGKRVLSSANIATPLRGDCSLRLWDLESGAELRRFGGGPEDNWGSEDNWVSAVAVLADDQRALSASDYILRLWDLESGAELRRFQGHKAGVLAVAVLADDERALSASHDHTLRLWDLESGAELRRLEGHEQWVAAVAVLADGKRALSASGDRTLRLWDLESGAALATLHCDAALTALAVDGGDRAVVGDALGRLHWIAIKPLEPD